jgi:uncharacterized protein (DUF433 family)
MTLIPAADPVPFRADANGDLRVGESRVLLDLVVEAFDGGATPETLVQSYPSLQLADVYAVIGYYLRHQGEVEDYLSHREQRADDVRQKIEANQPDMTGVRARLLARRLPADCRSAQECGGTMQSLL